MGILLWIVFGAIAGWIASMLMNTGGGLVWNIVVGIFGAILGGYLMQTLGGNGAVTGFDLYSFLVAILGACVFIAILRLIRGA